MLAGERLIGVINRLAGVEIRVSGSRRGVIDWNKVPFIVFPVAEVPLPLLHGGEVEGRTVDAADDSKGLKINIEISPLLARPEAGDLRLPADEGAYIVLKVFRPRSPRNFQPIVHAIERVEWSSVQPSIPMILISASVIGVGTRFGHRDENAGVRRPKLRVVVRCQDFHLAHHIRRHRPVLVERDHAVLVHEAFLHAHAVHCGFVARLLSAIDARIEGVGRSSRGDAGLENGKRDRRARVAGNQQG